MVGLPKLPVMGEGCVNGIVKVVKFNEKWQHSIAYEVEAVGYM